jgi:hypothetical protein
MKAEQKDKPDWWWYRAYLGVIATTVLVIFSLWAFSKYFS